MGQIADRLKRQRGGAVETARRDNKGFRERLDAATEAKKALLEKFRAQAATDQAATDQTLTDDVTPAKRQGGPKKRGA